MKFKFFIRAELHVGRKSAGEEDDGMPLRGDFSGWCYLRMVRYENRLSEGVISAYNTVIL